jgi:hypothetical protein
MANSSQARRLSPSRANAMAAQIAACVYCPPFSRIDFLKALRFRGKRPTPLYYYRELQNLRDPLHFRPVEV